MNHTYIFVAIIALWLSGWNISQAQHQTIYGNYFFNPEVYNPSFTGSSRMLKASLIHRYQWAGVEGAPVVSSLNVQIPTQTKASAGFTLLSDKSVLLRNTSFYSTFAYMVPLGKNHYFQFGLSGGVASQSIDMNQANTADPTILQAARNQAQWLGQFGFHYRRDRLILGFSVPKYQFTVLQEIQVTDKEGYFDWTHRMNMLMLTANYRLPLVPQKVALEPIIIYRAMNATQDQVELAGILHWQELLWIGSSYRQQNGLSAMAGVHVNKKIKIGYVYGMSYALGGSYSAGSHEFQMSLATGKRKSIRQ